MKKIEVSVSRLFGGQQKSSHWGWGVALGACVFTVSTGAFSETAIPSYITDGSLFELEGDTPEPLINSGMALKFLPLEAQVETVNGNGWRQEYKIDQPHRLPMGATYELFEATYTVTMSDGAKSIIAQHHGDDPTLMKLYYADSTELGVGGDGEFDLYVRLRDESLNGGESVHQLGVFEAGESFNIIMENDYGEVTVSATPANSDGIATGSAISSAKVRVSETPTDYFKFGNYLQAQETRDDNHQYGGEKCKAFTPPINDFAECYQYLGITQSEVILTNVSYVRNVDEDYVSLDVKGNNFCPSGNDAPATKFDLANWRIKVPDTDGTTYSPDALTTLNNDFFCLTDDNAMVFYAPVDGGTDGSTYPRSELREMINPDSSSDGWPVTGHHKVSASTTVTMAPSNGKIVIAQVDGMSESILGKIQWQSGKIKAQLRQINEDGSTGSYADFWFAEEARSFPVGKTFAWDMTVQDGVLYVTVDGETAVHDFAMLSTSPSDYSDDEFYFSVGSQPQDNTKDNSEGDVEAGEVLLHSFNVAHGDVPESGSSICPSDNAAPATAFNLTNWRIKLPDSAGSTVQSNELATLKNEFFCLSAEGEMVMYAPVNGGTAGSKYPRTELREMFDLESSDVGWGIKGSHTMGATTTITQEPGNGKIVIAQVDSLTDDILGKIQWDNDRIRVQLRQINEDGSSGSYENYWFDAGNDSFPVGTAFNWSMVVEDGILLVTVGEETVMHDFGSDVSPSDYSDDEFYFSVGSQPQDNEQDDPTAETEAGEALFASFEVTHFSDDDSASVNDEINSPNMGDANGDGILDVNQNNVASFSAVSTDNEGNSGIEGVYYTVEVDTDNSIGEGCGIIGGTGSTSEASLGSDINYDYPAGLLRFTLTTCEQANVVLYFHGLSSPPGVTRKYSPASDTWYSMPGAAITDVVINGETVYRTSYTLIDGGVGDDDGVENGTIVDPVGLAIGTASNVQNIPVFGPLGLLTVLIGLFWVGGDRRRKI